MRTREDLTPEQLDQLTAYFQSCRSEGKADAETLRELAGRGWAPEQLASLQRALVPPATEPSAELSEPNWRRLVWLGPLAYVGFLLLTIVAAVAGADVESMVTLVLTVTLIILLASTVALLIKCAKSQRPWRIPAVVSLSVFGCFLVLLLLVGFGLGSTPANIQASADQTAVEHPQRAEAQAAPGKDAGDVQPPTGSAPSDEAPVASSVAYCIMPGERGDKEFPFSNWRRFARDITVPMQANDEEIGATLEAAMEEYRGMHPQATHLHVTAWWEGGENTVAYARITWAPGGDWGATPGSAPMALSTEMPMSERPATAVQDAGPARHAEEEAAHRERAQGEAARAAAERRKAGEQTARLHAWVMAQDFVKDSLRSPSTASFGGIFGDNQNPDDCVVQVSYDTYIVTGWVDAQNAFGATIRSDFRCKLMNTEGDKWKCLDLKIESR